LSAAFSASWRSRGDILFSQTTQLVLTAADYSNVFAADQLAALFAFNTSGNGTLGNGTLVIAPGGDALATTSTR
jgi:hypothetical protein